MTGCDIVKIQFPEIGICGLSCRFFPRYHAEGSGRCGGCKTESRMSAGCPFINDGRSKSYYCVAETVMEPGELEEALGKAGKDAAERDRKGRARALHAVFDDIAGRKGYLLKLRT